MTLWLLAVVVGGGLNNDLKSPERGGRSLFLIFTRTSTLAFAVLCFSVVSKSKTFLSNPSIKGP